MPIRFVADCNTKPRSGRNKNVTRYHAGPRHIVRDPVPTLTAIVLTREMLDLSHAIADNRTQQLTCRTPRTAEEIERSNTVPIKFVRDEERRPRRIMTGKFVKVPEVGEVLASLGKVPPGQSIEVNLSDASVKDLKQQGAKNPARSLVNVFRRRFNSAGLSFEAYASDEKTVTVTRVRDNGETKPKKK